MPRKPKPIPPHLEEFLAGLEAQVLAGKVPSRDEALRPVEQRLGRIIDIEVEIQEYPKAKERFDLIRRRTFMRIEDGAIGKAADGSASATTLLRGMGAITPVQGGGSRGDNGRLQLERDHRAKVGAARGKW